MTASAGRSATMLLRAALSLLLALLLADHAAAASRVCRDLEAKLASSDTGGGGRMARKYDDAIRTQEGQLSKARRQARSNGCDFRVSGVRMRADCGGLNATIAKMERNLLKLQRTRASMGGGNPRRERARILAALDVNGCRERPETGRTLPQAVDRRARTSIFDQIFGGGIRHRRSVDDDTTDARDDNQVRRIINDGSFPQSTPTGGDLRTLCVRMCDGYFFPISNNSGRGDLTRDQQICEARCPGAEVQLYFHRFPDEDTEQMVSAGSGQPYTAMSTAFLYRQADFQRPAGCGCNEGPKGFSIIAGELPKAEPETPTETVVPRPWARPDPADDPETLANRAGGLDMAALRRMAPQPAETASIAEETGDKRVRVVGPVFLPDPEAAIDLRAPARKDGL